MDGRIAGAATTGARPRILVEIDDDSRQPDAGHFAPTRGGQEDGVVLVGGGDAKGQVAAWRWTPTGPAPFDDLVVVGAGLPQISLVQRMVAPADLERLRAGQHDERVAHERWSRSRGALGTPTWRRLRGLHVAIVGCGRTGSMVAAALARGGVRRLTLIDPDRIDTHNLGEMDAVTSAHVGMPKAEALVSALSSDVHADIRALTVGVDRLSAFRAARETDVLVACADDPVARLLTSLLGVAYLRPVLDIGTGIFGEGDGRRMGLDVRLLLPGACLACLGGVAGLERSAVLTSQPVNTEAWRAERAGSLRSLNQTAVGLGVRLLEDLMDSRIGSSTWLNVTFDVEGMPVLTRLRASASDASACPVCAWSGTGDDVMPNVRNLLEAARQWQHRGP